MVRSRPGARGGSSMLRSFMKLAARSPGEPGIGHAVKSWWLLDAFLGALSDFSPTVSGGSQARAPCLAGAKATRAAGRGLRGHARDVCALFRAAWARGPA